MQIVAPIPTLSDEFSHHYEYRENQRFSPEVNRKTRLFTALIPCVTGLGCMYQTVATLHDRRTYPPPGKFVDVDGCRLHMQTAGQGTLSVVLETGLGGMSSAWGWVQPETAKFCRVASYDRAGLGWSGPDSAPKTASLACRRLRSALLRSHVPPPYVLVGHSMGGLFIRVFADLYPDEVAGMVLLDAVHPDQHLRSADINEHMCSGFRFLKAAPLLARLGYVRLAGLLDSWAEGLPARQAAESEAFLAAYQHLKTTRDESLAWETICAEARCTSGLGAIPLAVVTAGKDVMWGHPDLQRDLATLSSESVHFAVKGADHVTLITRREHALLVVEAIRHVVERVKTHR
ncbi:MAG: alpha/beta hydrolase [Desulfuromonadales bacterium]|nr:alpha/beta hydrolase [Desulfuromonadales bacterium]